MELNEEHLYDLRAQRELMRGGQFQHNQWLKFLDELNEGLTSMMLSLKFSVADDLRRPPEDVMATEIQPVLEQLKYYRKALKDQVWSLLAGGHAERSGRKFVTYKEPLGMLLVLAPSYSPFLLPMLATISAICVGNTVALKLSQKSVKTYAILARILSGIRSKCVVLLEDKQNKLGSLLLQQWDFDHVFYAGREDGAKEIAECAAKKFIKCTCIVPGVRPVYIDKHVNVEDVVNQIVNAKFHDGGRFYLTSDYLMVHADIFDEVKLDLVRAFKAVQWGGKESGCKEHAENLDMYCHFPSIKEYNEIDSIVAKRDREPFKTDGDYVNDPEKMLIRPVMMEVRSGADGAPLINPLPSGPYGPIFLLHLVKNHDQALDHINTYIRSPSTVCVFSKKVEHIVQFSRYVRCGQLIVNSVEKFHCESVYLNGVGQTGNGLIGGKLGTDNFSYYKTHIMSPSEDNLEFPLDQQQKADEYLL